MAGDGWNLGLHYELVACESKLTAHHTPAAKNNYELDLLLRFSDLWLFLLG
jgi:hypothetical protein